MTKFSIDQVGHQKPKASVLCFTRESPQNRISSYTMLCPIPPQSLIPTPAMEKICPTCVFALLTRALQAMVLGKHNVVLLSYQVPPTAEMQAPKPQVVTRFGVRRTPPFSHAIEPRRPPREEAPRQRRRAPRSPRKAK